MSLDQDKDLIQRLNESKKNRDDLIQRKFKISAELDSTRKELRSLNAEAEELFGTSDLDELKKILITNRKGNASAVEDLDKELEEFESVIVKSESAAKNIAV